MSFGCLFINPILLANRIHKYFISIFLFIRDVAEVNVDLSSMACKRHKSISQQAIKRTWTHDEEYHPEKLPRVVEENFS